MIKQCDVCNTPFDAKRKSAKYCSDDCRNNRTGEYNGVKIKRVDDELIESIYKDLGLGEVMTDEAREVSWVKSGINELDALVDMNNTSAYPGGGFPRNRITELYGRKGVGKTTIMANVLPKMGGRILYFDAENALVTKPQENVRVISENILEIIEPIVSRALKAKMYDVIVVDSIAAMSCQTELDGDVAAANIGVKPRLMHAWMRRVIHDLRDSGTALVFINQERISVGIYATKYTPGGTCVDYAASLRIEMSSLSKDKIIQNKKQVGHWVNLKLEKNRFGPTNATSRFKALYDTPINPSDKDDVLDQSQLDDIEKKRRIENNITPEF